MKAFAASVLLVFFFASSAQAIEMEGLIGYAGTHNSNKPSNYVDSGGGVLYGFAGRYELGPGFIESGFLYTATSITTQEPFGKVKTSGSFWIIPLLYRMYVLPPFVSVALGPDYAIVSNSSLTVDGNNIGNAYSSGYGSHFGVEASAQGVKDLGENLGVVLDIRYRYGLADTISLSGTGVRYSTYIIALGIQKHLE